MKGVTRLKVKIIKSKPSYWYKVGQEYEATGETGRTSDGVVVYKTGCGGIAVDDCEIILDSIPKMTREQMNEQMLSHFDTIRQTFLYKNNNYGADDDPLFNFRTAAGNVLGEANAENMYKTLMIYMQKHLAALCKNGLKDPEFNERCKDLIIYSLISMVMHDEMEDN